MHIDARYLDDHTNIEGDICIVGSGAAGISFALEWINTPYKVILLEGGGFEYDNQVQNLYAGKNTGQRYYPLRSSRLHYFGGTTNHWAGMCSPYDPIDFKKRDWVPHSGWPITRLDLDPFYARANKVLELGPYRYDIEYLKEVRPNKETLPLDEGVVWNKMWQFSPPTRFNKKYRDDIVNAKNIHLYTYANLTNIIANDSINSIDKLELKNHANKTHNVKAKHYVLACGAIQNARMLLASNKQANKGLGNQNDLVGRYFMEHLEVISAQMFLKKPFAMDLYGFDPKSWTTPRAEIGLTEEIQEKHQILNGTISFTPMALTKSQKPMIDVWTSDDPLESEKKLYENFEDYDKIDRSVKNPYETNVFELFTRMEQAPNPNSRITLDSEKDELGVQRAKLHWDLTELDKHSMRKIYEIFGEAVGKSGIGRVKMYDFLWKANNSEMLKTLGGGWHHMGTTKMHDDPKQGVVDANCKIHGLSNLFIAGSGCCSTAGAPNPTLNLVALSLRLSDHLKTLMRNN
ncbi:FAD-dependent oxidoreductase [Tamlana flava]|uniref:FAD-dependent oxidoreductase n=1 Tax=Tamlana flava TaxID=3158572 RepID=UPI00351AF6D1